MSDETERLLAGVAQGDRRCIDELIAYVYDELKSIAFNKLRQEDKGHTLQPTALVNEVFIRLIGQTRVDWKNRAHFLAVAATIMRHVLIDHARKQSAEKRGGRAERIKLGIELEQGVETDLLDLLALDDALGKLAKLNERHAKVVELRYFGGLGIHETAELLGVSPATIKNDWRTARAWLSIQLGSDTEE